MRTATTNAIFIDDDMVDLMNTQDDRDDGNHEDD